MIGPDLTDRYFPSTIHILHYNTSAECGFIWGDNQVADLPVGHCSLDTAILGSRTKKTHNTLFIQ